MNMGQNYKEFRGERGKNDMRNIMRTAAEVMLFYMTFYLKSLMMHMWDCEGKGRECKADTFGRRLQNVALYQTDRLYKEQVLFWPLASESYEQVMQMMKSPIAATRTLGEIGGAVSLTFRHPLYSLWNTEEEIWDTLEPTQTDPNLWCCDSTPVCNEEERSIELGCTDIEACNFNCNVLEDDGSCEYAMENYDCDGNCIIVIDCFGECGGSAVEDCAGVCEGSSILDECEI